MLINTVLIFLQNILPIFLVISLLLAQQKLVYKIKPSRSYLSVIQLLKVTVSGLLLISLLNYYMPIISPLFSGTGLELIFSILFSWIYCLIVISISTNKRPSNKNGINLGIILLVLCVHGSYFSFYILSFTIESASFEILYSGIVIGVIIGTGICFSIAILLYFILRKLDETTKGKAASYFLLFFGVGQLMQALQLLEQVDIISSNIHLWSTSYLIAEDSELGYLLTILFGYEATPSAMELMVYFSAIVVSILINKYMAYQQNGNIDRIKGTD